VYGNCKASNEACQSDAASVQNLNDCYDMCKNGDMECHAFAYGISNGICINYKKCADSGDAREAARWG
jgi:hypothetical protein